MHSLNYVIVYCIISLRAKRAAWYASAVFACQFSVKKETIRIADQTLAPKFISDVVDLKNIRRDAFNLIASGCGTGKSYFITHHLQQYFPDVAPEEIIFITSRSLTADQQARVSGVAKYNPKDTAIVNFWNGDPRAGTTVDGTGMRIMTYDKLVFILSNCNTIGYRTLVNAKIVVFDECHTLFSDTFISNIDAIKVWVRDMLDIGDKIIMGLTATPEILRFNAERWGVIVHNLNEEILMKYRAKHMICTTFEHIPELLDFGRLLGKTLIMCHSYKQCKQLEARIKNSTILTSASNEHYTPEMSMIRDYISKYERLPDKFFVPSAAELARRAEGKHARTDDGVWKDLHVLIATTTAREGYNLCPDSGIQNIISCYGDDLHLTQICGRARYNLDNVVVALTRRCAEDSFRPEDYLPVRRQEFRDFMNGGDGACWFKSVSHLVEGDLDDVEIVGVGPSPEKFSQYIDSRWLVPDDCPDDQLPAYRIWRAEDKQELIDKCKECKLADRKKSRFTFLRVLSILTDMGYVIQSGRAYDGEKTQHTYKLITKSDYAKIT